jgi:hypothetical protein
LWFSMNRTNRLFLKTSSVAGIGSGQMRGEQLQ